MSRLKSALLLACALSIGASYAVAGPLAVDTTSIPGFHGTASFQGYDLSHNPSGLTGTIYNEGGLLTGEEPGFANSTLQDYHLKSTSTCVNAGTSPTPEALAVSMQYVKHRSVESRMVSGPIDVGAFEFSDGVPPVAPRNLRKTAE